MKVFELMYELNKMPSGAEVRFHTLAPVDEMYNYEDDENFYELDYVISSIELIKHMKNQDEIVIIGDN